MRYGQLGLLMILAVTSRGAPAEPVQAPPYGVPSEEAIASATRLVKETFRAEYAAAVSLPQRAALAQRLLKEAKETQGEAAARYVLLCEARDLGAKAADAPTACRAIEMLGRQFGMATGEATVTALSTAARVALTPQSQEALARAALGAADQALLRDEYEVATRLGAIADAAAARTQKLVLIHECQAKTKEINWASHEFAQAKAAMDVLSTRPNDADARSAAGRFKCLVKNDWEHGLPLLREGSDASYRDLAERDLAAGTASAAVQKETGDRWWDLGETFTGRARTCCRNRAATWYQKCAGKLAGLQRTVVEKRLAEVDAAYLRDLHLEPGLVGEYFGDEKWEKPLARKVDPNIDFEWNSAAGEGLPRDNFSVRWSGLLRVQTAGKYTLTLVVNEGGRVIIDERVVLDEPDGTRKRKGTSGTVLLTEGLHPIRVELHDGGGLARIRLSWQPPGAAAEEVIPASAFLHESGK